MEPNVTQSSHQNRPHARGTRHLRVGIELTDKTARIASMWVVDQPVVQSERVVGPLLIRIDLAGMPVLVQGFDDPRVTRSTYRKGVGHMYAVVGSGIVYASVPFADVRQLAEVRIRLLDASNVSKVPTDAAQILKLFDSPPASARGVVDLSTTDLRKHADYEKLATTLGIPVERARFEIYMDRERRFRWRLRRPTGEVAAESCGGFAAREACEEDIRWVRAHAADASVVALDMGGNVC